MKKGTRLLALLVVVLMSVFLAGCGNTPPKELSSSAEQVQNEINSTKDTVKKARDALNAELGKPAYKFMEGYSDTDKHVTKFSEADAKVADAEKLFADKARGPLDKYDPNKQSEILSSLDAVQKLLGEAKALAAEPSVWIKRVAETRKNPISFVNALDARVAPNAKTEADLLVAGNDAKANWPHQVRAIDDRVAKGSRELKAANDALANVKKEAEKPSPNFAVMTRFADDAKRNADAFFKTNGTVRAQLDELPTTETHTVLDIRVDGEIEIGRTSWDEGSDANTDWDYEYPPVVTNDGELLLYFSKFQPGTLIAAQVPGVFSSEFRTENGVDKAMWDKLGIDARKDWKDGAWDGHEGAEYTLEEVSVTTCYKLKVMRNGKPDSSGRPPADQNECDKYNNDADLANGIYWDEAEEPNFNAIGMDVYSKGAGDFADQATTEASPPGIAYVGDASAGQWQRDGSGNEFWVFYGQYLFFSNLIGGPHSGIYRHEYDLWNRDYRRNNREYYGGSAAVPRFGAGSPQAGGRFSNTQFSKAKLGSPSVRSAGPSLRGGGPGGGGK